MNIHIALIISSLNSGGAERVLSNLANHWALEGAQVDLITLVDSSVKPFYFLDEKVKLIQLNQSQYSSSLFLRTRNVLFRVLSLRKLFKFSNPDIMISFVDVTNLTSLLASIGLKIPLIVSERTNPCFHRLPFFYKFLRKFLYPIAFCVVVQTRSAGNYFKRFNNILTIPNFVIRPKRKKLCFKSVQKLISVGRLNPFKGLDTMIHAFFHLSLRYPCLKLVIYGEGPERKNLQKLIDSFGLQKKIFLSGVTFEIQEILSDSDIFIFPSRYEGFPNALCEAMSVGLPVVASNCSGNVDIVRDGVDGRLFPVDDVNALIQILEELIEDEGQRRMLAKNAQSVCDRFSADGIFKKWDDLIESVLDHKLSFGSHSGGIYT